MKNAILCLAFLVTSTAFAHENVSRSLASIKESIRVDHARELLGKSYKRSIVSTFEKRLGLEGNILKTVENRLPKKFKKDARNITQAIIKESQKHSLDPYFVMAMIAGESSFNPVAVGPVGEIGLMQLRPATGEWMAEKINFQWKGDATLRDPVANIKLGTAYIAWLREKFHHHGQLYLAAYNMGAKSVKNAVSRKIWPKDYPRHVMKRYLAFYKEIEITKI
jgi:soluble lytic murein transglycosylase